MDRLHLGSGARLIAHWRNIDLEPPADAPAELMPFFEAHDLRTGLPQIADSSVSLIFSEHTLEHFTRHDGVRLLRECYRVLTPGGVIRVSVPDLGRLVTAYLERDLCFAEAVGWRPASPARLLNEGMREWGHMFVYDATELAAVFREAGFIPAHVRHGVTTVSDMPIEGRPFLGDIVVESMR